MVEFVGFDCGKLSPEFLKKELISFSFIIVIDNERMSKLDSIGCKEK